MILKVFLCIIVYNNTIIIVIISVDFYLIIHFHITPGVQICVIFAIITGSYISYQK